MTRIAILGATGMIGSYLCSHLPGNYTLIPVTRKDVDLTLRDDTISFFKEHRFNIVINCAGSTNTDMVPFNATAARTNILIGSNLFESSQYFDKMLNVGSGAEFDRRFDINNAKEESLSTVHPIDHYGLSKHICTMAFLKTANIYTLRVFGVFDKSEPATRLLKKIIENQITLLHNRFFDYVSLSDFTKVVDFCIQNTPMYNDINVVYPEKITLLDFVQRFCKINNLPDTYIPRISNNNINYTGDASRLASLGIKLDGMDSGLKGYL